LVRKGHEFPSTQRLPLEPSNHKINSDSSEEDYGTSDFKEFRDTVSLPKEKKKTIEDQAKEELKAWTSL